MSVTTQTQSPRCLLRNKANRRSAKAISPSAKFDDAHSIFREQQLHFFKQPTTLQNDLSNPRCILKGFHQKPLLQISVGTCRGWHLSNRACISILRHSRLWISSWTCRLDSQTVTLYTRRSIIGYGLLSMIAMKHQYTGDIPGHSHMSNGWLSRLWRRAFRKSWCKVQ